MSDDQAYAATPAAELKRQIMDSRIPKNEREWWASREITRLTELLALTPTTVTADEVLEVAAKIADDLHVMRLPVKDGDCCNHTNACGTASAIRELKGRYAIPFKSSPASHVKASSGGPAACPSGPCSECAGPHHFSDMMVGFAEEEPDHPAAKLGIDSWYDCKHCDAWVEDLDENHFSE